MRRPLAVAAIALELAAPAFAQDTAEPQLQRGGTFFEPPARVDSEYLPRARSPETPDGFAPDGEDRSRLQLRLALDVPLRHASAVGFGSQGARAASPTLQADLRYTPSPGSPWFVRLIFYRYLRATEQQPWNPDYFYAFGYDDSRPDTWSFTYANYTGTRWSPDEASRQGRFNFREGVWSLARRFELPAAVRPVFLVGDGDQAVCRTSFELTPRFWDGASGTLRSIRTAVTLGCRYTRPDGWFAEVTAFGYPRQRTQQPWDPDYTYAIGWSDWRPGTLSLQYGNYSGNRFPGRARGPGEGTPRSGSITLSWRLDW